jgi:hypothetical protein
MLVQDQQLSADVCVRVYVYYIYICTSMLFLKIVWYSTRDCTYNE